MDHKYAYYSNNAKSLIDQVSQGCQPDCSGWHLQAFQNASKSIRNRQNMHNSRQNPSNVSKQRSPDNIHKPSSSENINKASSSNRSRPRSRENVYQSRSPKKSQTQSDGRHILKPREDYYKIRPPRDIKKAKSPQKILGHGACKQDSRSSSREDIPKCCQTNSKPYLIDIPKSRSPQNIQKTCSPHYSPKPGSPHHLPKTGSPHRSSKAESSHHPPKTRSPQQSHIRRSREDVHRPRSRDNLHEDIHRYQHMQRTSRTDGHCRHECVQRPCSRERAQRRSSREKVQRRGSNEKVHRHGSRERVQKRGSRERVQRSGSRESGNGLGSGKVIRGHGSRERSHTPDSREREQRSSRREKLQRPCSRENIHRPCSRENVQRPCSRDGRHKLCSSERVHKPGSHERVQRPASRERLHRPGSRERLQRSRSCERVQRPGSRERVERSGSRERVKRPGSRERVERPGSRERVQRPGSRERVQRPGSRERVQRPGSRERVERPGSRERVKRPGSRERVERPCSRERVKRPGSRERVQRLGSRERVQRPGSPERVERPGSREKVQRPDRRERVQRPGSHERVQRPGSRERVQRPGSRERVQRPGSRERVQRPGSQEREHRPREVAGDYRGQGGDAAHNLMRKSSHGHDAGDECGCLVAKKMEKLKADEKLRKKGSKKKGEGDSLWAQWKRMTQKKPTELDNLQKVLRRLGEMRAYHWWLVCAAAPLAFMWAYVLYAQMFVVATPLHFCATKQLKAAKDVADDVAFRQEISIPKVNGVFDKCNKYARAYSKITNDSKKNDIEGLLKSDKPASVVPCDEGWEFVHDDIPYCTLSSEAQLVCENAYKKVIPHCLFFVGACLGSLGFGVMGDELGRLPALVVSNTVVVLGSLASAGTSSVWYFALARLLAGLGYDTCFMAIYILVLEFVGPHYRALAVNVLLALFFCLGGLLMPSIAAVIANRTNFMYATSLPMLMVLAFPFFLPESLRWLLLRGKLSRALRVIAKMQTAHKREVPQQDLDNLIYEIVNYPVSGNIRDAMSSPYIRAMVSIFALFYLVVMTLFETLVLLTEHTGVGFFTAFRISASMELFAGLVVAFFVNKGGRRLFTRVPMIIAGILTFLAAGSTKGTGLTAMTTVARFATAMARNTLFLWVVEAMPTGARAAGSAIAHAGGHLGCIFSPIFAYQVGHNDSTWPLTLLGLLTLLAAMFICILPETMHKSLPQKISVSKKRFKQSLQSFRAYFTWQGILEATYMKRKKKRKERDQYTQPLAQHPSPRAAHGDTPAAHDLLRRTMPRQWRTSDGII